MEESPFRKKLDGQDWGTLYPRLVDFAQRRCGAKARGKDLAQEAITRVYAFDSKWDPEKEPDLFRYLMSVVNSVLANERAGATEQRTVSLDQTKMRHERQVRRKAEQVADTGPTALAQLADTELYAKLLALLEERLKDDADAARILTLWCDGTDAPKDLAHATGWTTEKVRATRVRLLRHATAVAAELDAARAQNDEDDEEVP